MIKPRFTRVEVHRMVQEKSDRIEKAILTNLTRLGEECVNQARETNSYEDQTGNLRSSIGYVIVAHGKIIQQGGFDKVSKSSQTATVEGAATGANFAKEIAAQYTTGYAVIVVAGMNYAAAVESRGLDVLSSAENYAKQRAPQVIASLKSKIDNLK